MPESGDHRCGDERDGWHEERRVDGGSYQEQEDLVAPHGLDLRTSSQHEIQRDRHEQEQSLGRYGETEEVGPAALQLPTQVHARLGHNGVGQEMSVVADAPNRPRDAEHRRSAEKDRGRHRGTRSRRASASHITMTTARTTPSGRVIVASAIAMPPTAGRSDSTASKAASTSAVNSGVSIPLGP